MVVADMRRLLTILLIVIIAIGAIMTYRSIIDQINYTKIAIQAGVTPYSVKKAIKVLESGDKKIAPLNSNKTILLQKKKDHLYQGDFTYGRLTEFLAPYGGSLKIGWARAFSTRKTEHTC